MARVTVAAYAGDTAALVWIAEDQGFFADAGLDVEIKQFEAGKLAADALWAGEADLSTSAAFVLVSRSFAGPDAKVLATVASSETNFLVGRRDRGIERPEDLAGKTVGVTRGSAGEFFLGRFLDFNNLRADDITVVDRPPSGLVQGIADGTLDAAVTWNPNAFEMRRRLGDQAAVFPAQGGQELYFLLLADAGWLAENETSARAFLAALSRAEAFAEERPGDVRSLLIRLFGYDPGYADHALETHRFTVEMPQALIISLENQARWAIESGLAAAGRVPNYLDFLHLGALDAVRPVAVTVIR